MKSFDCNICGEDKPEHERVAQHMRYCKECHNDYQKVRRRVREAGLRFTMKSYKINRKKRGLPVADAETVMGRPPREAPAPKNCEACQEVFYTNTSAAYKEEDNDQRICRPCGVDFEWHRDNQTDAIEDLTVDWYVFFRNNDVTDKDTGETSRGLTVYLRGQRGRPTNAALALAARQHTKVRTAIKLFGTPENLLEQLEQSKNTS